MKIVQIAVAGHANTMQTQADLTLFALCDDGRLFELNSSNRSWVEVPLPLAAKPTEAEGE